jgi:hypothetical protein
MDLDALMGGGGGSAGSSGVAAGPASSAQSGNVFGAPAQASNLVPLLAVAVVVVFALVAILKK